MPPFDFAEYLKQEAIARVEYALKLQRADEIARENDRLRRELTQVQRDFCKAVVNRYAPTLNDSLRFRPEDIADARGWDCFKD